MLQTKQHIWYTGGCWDVNKLCILHYAPTNRQCISVYYAVNIMSRLRIMAAHMLIIGHILMTETIFMLISYESESYYEAILITFGGWH